MTAHEPSPARQPCRESRHLTPASAAERKIGAASRPAEGPKAGHRAPNPTGGTDGWTAVFLARGTGGSSLQRRFLPAARSRAELQRGGHGLLGFGPAAVTGFLHDWSCCRNNTKH